MDVDNRLKDKVAIVTGAAQGLGEASARRFAQSSARVALIDVKADKGERVAAEIRESGGEAQFFMCDLTKMADVEAVIAAVDRHFGQIDVLYNNAGYSEAGTVETCRKAPGTGCSTSTSRRNTW